MSQIEESVTIQFVNIKHIKIRMLFHQYFAPPPP